MKRSNFNLLFILTLGSCTGITNPFATKREPEVDTILYSSPSKINFFDTTCELGNVKEGQTKTVVYKYQNTGDKPLLLFNVSPGCGCTIAKYSHKPLAPGLTDSIVASFDSKGKEGSYLKNIKVNCNSQEKVHNLAFKVNVIK